LSAPRVVPLLLTFAIVATSPAAVFADENKARAEFKQGVAAARRGQFGVAANHYRKSLRYKPHARTYFNLGVVLEELKQYGEALDAYQNFVRTAIAKRDRVQVEEIEARIANLRQRLAALVVVTSEPGGATVYVDGSDRAAGTTPLKLSLPPGPHTMRLTMPRRQPQEKTVNVEPEIDQTFSFTLGEVHGSLSIRSNVAGSSVVVDKIQVGTIEDSELEREIMPGERRVIVRAAGYQDATETLVVAPAETIGMNVTLARQRSTTSWIVLGSLSGASLVATAVAAVLGVQAEQDDDTSLARKVDVVGGTAAALGAAAVVYYFFTRPGDSKIEVDRVPAE